MRKSLSVLVVDDDLQMLNYLKTLLTRRWSYRVTVAQRGERALELLEEGLQPDFILLDLGLPGVDGLEVLRRIGTLKGPKGEPFVIVLSGVEAVKTVVEAMQLGAVDYLKKPFEEEELEIAIRRALERREILAEVKTLREQVRAKEEIVPLTGASAAMEEVTRVVEQVADTDATVLFRGESGVGKEVVAHLLHRRSSRRGPFVKVNCAAIPPGLLESELFGYERGAFTGAQSQKPGRFELAQNGTLFLDEIGEADPLIQSKLLQVLEHRRFTRLGGKREIQVDVRIVAATNQDLEAAVEARSFRSDLYYRINVITIAIPPLRERKEDIPALCHYFLEKYNGRYQRRRDGLSPGLLELFLRYDWPGNVRELENAIKRVVALDGEGVVSQGLLGALGRSDGKRPHPGAVDFYQDERVPLKEIGQRAASEAEREAIRAVLTRTHWNRQQAAEILGISRRTLSSKIQEYDLK